MSGSPAPTAAISVTRDRLIALLADLCPAARIDLAGAVTVPCPLPHADRWRDYLTAGYHADLTYLARGADDRVDPTRRNPWARSLLVFAQRYGDGWDPDDRSSAVGAEPGRPWTDGVARYARGLDYHDVLLASIRSVVDGLAAALPGLRAQPAVDTGPYLEREYAWLAGLGFLGKNSCLIHERLGSGLFLGVAPTNLVVAGMSAGGHPDAAPLYAVAPRSRPGAADLATLGTAADTNRCGRCTRCLDACPTGALTAPFTLDSRRCIATWTIEWRGRAPDDARAQQGGLLFGCDICQAVCPWNVAAARRAGRDEMFSAPDAPAAPAAPVASAVLPTLPFEYATLTDHAEIELSDLLRIDSDEFRRRFRRTPLWRCHTVALPSRRLTP